MNVSVFGQSTQRESKSCPTFRKPEPQFPSALESKDVQTRPSKAFKHKPGNFNSSLKNGCDENPHAQYLPTKDVRYDRNADGSDANDL